MSSGVKSLSDCLVSFPLDGVADAETVLADFDIDVELVVLGDEPDLEV